MEFNWDAQLPAAQAQNLQRTTQHTTQCSSTPAPEEDALDSLENTICYLSQHSVIVCKQHATAVQNVGVHLRDHHTVTRQARQLITERFKGLHIKGPKDVELPAPLGLPIEELGLPRDGFQCEEEDCYFITIHVDGLRKHCKSKHGLVWKGNKSTIHQKVKVQTFFRAGGLQRYFVVNAADYGEPSIPQEVADVVSMQLAGWKATQQIHNEKAQVMDAEAAKTDKTGWFKRTGWLEHFGNRNLVHLAHQVRLPDQGEVKLQQAAKLVELLVERSVAGLSTLPQETRRWLRSAKQSEVDQRPMARLQNPESQAVYTSYVVKFLGLQRCTAMKMTTLSKAAVLQQEAVQTPIQTVAQTAIPWSVLTCIIGSTERTKPT
ncbi:hypothetical protein EJ02DRAFT_516885 [Clathrospora elynae]|uniref:C2H2-type domain-containing protein n=1 Tax=Clathrospora elynae TaxID=706981 RepID=A0A6A5S4C4_9PLEO|nr:hypothetical protein EJ02DRAFT_516885 [Clathrospora elynae]